MSALHTMAAPAVDFPREANAYSHQVFAEGPRYLIGDDADCDAPEVQLRRHDFDEDSQGEDEVDDMVKEDMMKLESSFHGISERYRLVNRIGEGTFRHSVSILMPVANCWRLAGTFSTVYKAEDLLYDIYENEWDTPQGTQPESWTSPPPKKRRLEDRHGRPLPIRRKKPRYVALKKIYVTSSPARIQNELELLHDLKGCRSVCPLITAFRHHDQVVAVLPYFPHTDFRIQYRTFMVADMRHYFRSLFTALHSVHKHDIIHRDIKPT